MAVLSLLDTPGKDKFQELSQHNIVDKNGDIIIIINSIIFFANVFDLINIE
jgi:GTPase SAR1 family protein